ncbi:imelysin family protein [Marinobacter bryozoorum]|uniref:imelysin family protein n=1 Tax=Marinobacter bryozoorum TaxID=256324 RepID=UPI0020043B98|nr:imelysin family protein [Marinobacter bryozoorum]MCK7546207.1 imelysin family protein [Marinobacter bryozoorum]
MQPIARLLCTSILVATSPFAWASDADTEARQQWHEGIATGYQSLTTETSELAESARDYCVESAEDSRARLEAAWLDAFLAWQRVRFVDFGPVENNNLSWQFQFWPDPKNLIARKAAYLIGNDEAITPQVVSQSGVAVQGFPMMEYLLFDQQLNAGDNALPSARTCELLTNVAGHVKSNSGELMAGWLAFGPHYLETAQYFDTTIRAGMATLEILEERRLAQPMGLRGNGKRNPYITDAWRSGNTLMTIEATVDGLRQFFLPGLATLLEAKSEPDLAERIRKQFSEVQQNFPGAHLPMATALNEEDQFRVLQSLYVDISQLTTLVNDQAAVALGVVRGFNSSDGD